MNKDLSPEEALKAKYAQDNKLVKEKLLAEYQEFASLFSRRASDELLTHRAGVDH